MNMDWLPHIMNEVMKFRTSAAIHTGKQPYTFGGLSENDGVLMSWVDNYDLNVFTPNGCCETHSLVVELTQQPESGPADEEMSASNSEEDIVINTTAKSIRNKSSEA